MVKNQIRFFIIISLKTNPAKNLLMKKLLLFSILGFLVFASCSKDSSDTFEASQQDLTGKWIISKVTIDGVDISGTISDCPNKENIVVNGQGNASWTDFIGDNCTSITDDLVFTISNANSFNISGGESGTIYFANRFLNQTKIKINESTTIGSIENDYEYEFVKQ